MSTANNISTSHLYSDDIEEMREADSNWNYEFAQLETGYLQGMAIGLECGPIEITHNRYGRKIHYCGTPPDGSIALVINLNQSEDGIWAGESFSEDDILIQSADKEAELFTPSSYDIIVIAIPEWMLATRLSDLTRENPDNILKIQGVFTPRPEQLLSLRNTGRSILISTANPTAGKKDAPTIEDMAESIVEMTALTLTELQRLDSTAKTCKDQSCQRQTQLIRKAREYCREREEHTIRISDLCRELEVSERTLRYIFRERINMSPLDFLKKIKLNNVYKKLRKSDPREILVKQVALDHGFFHLGQFSRDFRNLFGELPSQTLASKRPSQRRCIQHLS